MDKFEKSFAGYTETFGVPDRIELMLCDLNGILRGKWLPGDQTGKFAKGDVRLPLSTYAPNILGEEVEETGLGIVAGDPDGRLVPVESSLAPVPWAKGNVAQMLVEMVEAGKDDNPLSPRGILQSVLDRFAAKDMFPVVASELEFYIFKPRADASDAPQPPARTPDAQNYDLEILDRQEDILTEIQGACAVQGLATDTLIAEYGPGQFEINFHHTADVLRAADTALLFRRLVRAVMARHGMEASFMAKPYAEFPGNGMHLHASLVNGAGENVFSSDEGVGETLQNAVAGVLSSMADLQAIFAPHMNSYRRFQPNSFAPTAPDWALDHRGAAVRIPATKGPGARLEHRISGADVNPYLAFAAILGGMLHGIETKPALPLSLDDPKATPSTPLGHDWLMAVERFAQADIAATIFGTEYRDIYATLRRDEISKIATRLTQVEYEVYLGRL